VDDGRGVVHRPDCPRADGQVKALAVNGGREFAPATCRHCRRRPVLGGTGGFRGFARRPAREGWGDWRCLLGQALEGALVLFENAPQASLKVAVGAPGLDPLLDAGAHGLGCGSDRPAAGVCRPHGRAGLLGPACIPAVVTARPPKSTVAPTDTTKS
jgi:hypothetical protein